MYALGFIYYTCMEYVGIKNENIQSIKFEGKKIIEMLYRLTVNRL